MFQLSRKIDYGLFLTVELAKKQLNGKEEPLSLKKLAERHQLSFFFLQRVAQDLRNAQLIEADRGKLGGYHLAQKASGISLKNILEALEGPISIMHCFKLKNNECVRENWCSARKGLGLLREKLIDTFQNIYLTDLITPQHKIKNPIQILNV